MFEENQYTNRKHYQGFQVFFQWKNEWMNANVLPVKDCVDCLHFLVMLPCSKKMILRINDSGQWDEVKDGCTPFIENIGNAIEYHYAICN